MFHYLKKNTAWGCMVFLIASSQQTSHNHLAIMPSGAFPHQVCNIDRNKTTRPAPSSMGILGGMLKSNIFSRNIWGVTLTSSRFDLQPSYKFHNAKKFAPALREIQWVYCSAPSGGLQPTFVPWMYSHVCTCFVDSTVLIEYLTEYSGECYDEEDFVFHGKDDVRVTLTGVALIPGLDYNLFSLHVA